jgi:tRNA (Thr-GGU) A37 N-methylase
MARISKIDSVGVLTVQFNRDVKIPKYFNSFNQSILEITLINKTNSKLRVLDAIKTVEVINQDKKLDFKWTIKSFSSRKVTFKIDFD